jgi:hypothetical protein
VGAALLVAGPQLKREQINSNFVDLFGSGDLGELWIV